MNLEKLATDMLGCRKCENKLAQYGIEPRPIFAGGEGYPIVLVGQAPGITEYKKNAPFQGDAGQAIRALFESCNFNDFDEKVYQTSVTKCFPGRRENSTSDRRPSVLEVRNCSPFLVRQIELLRPKLIVLLGSLSWESYVSIRESETPGYCIREFKKRKAKDLRVPDLVGRKFEWKNSVVVPMIHPAGTANGARAGYPKLDEKSKELLREELAKV